MAPVLVRKKRNHSTYISSTARDNLQRNFILPTFCLAHLSLIILQQPVRGRNTKCSRWIWLRWKIEPDRVTSERMQRIKQETAKDPVLAFLCNVLTRKEAPEQLRQYWSFRDEISVHDGVAYRSHQVIVPSSLREEMLHKIPVAASEERSSLSFAWNASRNQEKMP